MSSAAIREVEVQGQVLRIQEASDFVEDGTGKAVTGAWVWDAAIVLAKFFDTPQWSPDALKGKRVVELGSGVGLCGLAVACLGADVTLTDRSVLIPALQRNIELNGLEERVQAQVYNWGEDCSTLSPPFDVVIGSDIIYDMEVVPSLIKSIRALSGPQTQIFLGYELRFGTTQAFPMMVANGLPWERIPPEKLHPDWRSDDIGVFKLQKEDVRE